MGTSYAGKLTVVTHAEQRMSLISSTHHAERFERRSAQVGRETTETNSGVWKNLDGQRICAKLSLLQCWLQVGGWETVEKIAHFTHYLNRVPMIP